jgi:hypothetical protein
MRTVGLRFRSLWLVRVTERLERQFEEQLALVSVRRVWLHLRGKLGTMRKFRKSPGFTWVSSNWGRMMREEMGSVLARVAC